MGRKAVKGYPEKSYYDNTVFNGIVATHDPLNEGSFALLTNFDIVDTGKSSIPRKGYTSTTFSIDGVSVVLSNKLFVFRDPNIQKDIIIDFNKLTDDTTSKYAYRVNVTQYNMTNNMLQGAHNIQLYESTDFLTHMKEIIPGLADVLTNPLSFLFTHSTIVGDSLLKPIRDRDGVTYYIGKMSYSFEDSTPIYYWLKFLYREKQTTVGGVTYTADTLVVSYIDTQKQVTTFLERNIASSTSIIPSPIRSQETVDVETTAVSEVNRPILIKVGSNYTTTKIPENYKTTLDVKIEPTFHLQDPKRILGSVNDNERWAFRFDFIDTSYETANKPIYKTPWRYLDPAKTLTGVCSDITELKLNPDNPNDLTYTYYVTSSASHSWYETTGETTYLSSIDYAEVKLFERMRLNGTSAPTSLGNLAYAYGKQLNLAGTFLPLSLSLDDIDNTLYDQMAYRFISEDDLKDSVSSMGHTLSDLNDRTISVDMTDAQIISPIYPTITVATVNAPIVPITYAAWTNATKMTLSDFVIHAKEKQKTRNIRIIFLPNIYRRQGTVSSVPFDYVYLCSVPGIYTNGLLKSSLSATGPVAPWSSILSLRKTHTFSLVNVGTDTYVDCFKDLGDLSLDDAIAYMPRSVFDRGVYLILYLKPYNQTMLDSYSDMTTPELELINRSWDESSYKQASSGVWAQEKDVVFIDEVDDENPEAIANAVNHIIFEDRLIIWSGNKVYISEEGDYYYFKNTMKKVFSEEVLKVISFKTILLVFTTQNLYAIYRAEIDEPTGTFTTEGLPEYQKVTEWFQQPVLYNINPEKKYLDVIQVYNQMILFYSNEGQLYMIKPSTMIDSETQFAIQYFNKSVNNILANYEQYINERLVRYGKLSIEDEENYVTKEDVQVKALIDIDLIKIFYTVPNRITFIVIYDVVNNRYTTYDTLSFTDIDFVKHVEGGEFYLTRHNNASYFTLPVVGINNVDQNVDMHFARMFKKEPLFTYIDTGNLNLNNHIRKRLRDLYVVLKNLDSTKILYNAEVIIDDTIVRPFYAPDFKVRMTNGPDSMMTVNRVPVEDLNELFGMNETIGTDGARTELNSYYLHHDNDFYNRNSLLKTETLNSSRLIEYNSSILGVGKVIRLRLQFISKGKYKLQSFGIVYKERQL